MATEEGYERVEREDDDVQRCFAGAGFPTLMV